jgi:hypothetical protein
VGLRSRRPSRFPIAHGSGNELGLLRRAEALGLPLVEADVHLHRGRLEVRHRKTAGPLPALWDRGSSRLLSPGAVARLRRLTATIAARPVRDREEARTLASWGVAGVITNGLELAGELMRIRRGTSRVDPGRTLA